MKEILERILENLSTKEVFLFRVRCGSCGAEYGNPPLRFSKADTVPENQQKQILFQAIYEQELRSARHAAIRESAQHMNFCPICKQVVCNRCFLICEDLDMCRHCAERLQEKGSPVMGDILDAVI